jgi:hypothetical protein
VLSVGTSVDYYHSVLLNGRYAEAMRPPELLPEKTTCVSLRAVDDEMAKTNRVKAQTVVLLT